jgi:hypothetical protein
MHNSCPTRLSSVDYILHTLVAVYRLSKWALTVVHNIRDYWVFGICPSSGIIKNTTFRKLNLFSSSGEGVGCTYSVGLVRES